MMAKGKKGRRRQRRVVRLVKIGIEKNSGGKLHVLDRVAFVEAQTILACPRRRGDDSLLTLVTQCKRKGIDDILTSISCRA